MRVRSVVGRNAQRSAARLGTEEEAVVEDLGMLEQVDEGTWESQDDEECEKAKQNEIDMKYEDEAFDRLRRGGHGGRTDVLLSQTMAKDESPKKNVLVGFTEERRLGQRWL